MRGVETDAPGGVDVTVFLIRASVTFRARRALTHFRQPIIFQVSTHLVLNTALEMSLSSRG